MNFQDINKYQNFQEIVLPEKIPVIQTIHPFTSTDTIFFQIPEGAKLPERPDGKIINGQRARQGQFPYQALLTIDGTYFCGGSLIDIAWVVTAGHCTYG